ncbi:saccharopine dehydrogenase [Halobacteriales archaeon QS_8_69_26]|nr:MAG: saccharopine dehydrogenase [Halobacteriales archaeon QS_8_69_26]
MSGDADGSSSGETGASPGDGSATDGDDARALIYGSYGYTGSLVAERAVQRGLAPVVAGRNERRVRRQADDLGVEGRAFDLADPGAVADRVRDVDVVVNCAGPFVDTYEPVVEACLRTGTHYLDITGEIEVFRAIAALDDRAREAGVTLMPGVGFDVVPTDCLAAHLYERLPSATRLFLAFEGFEGISPGTARTAVEGFGATVTLREDGRLVAVPIGERTRRIDFGDGPRLTTAIPWGDVVTAYHTTGIESVEVYAPVSWTQLRAMRASRPLAPFAKLPPVKATLRGLADAVASGPDEAARRGGEVRIWGRVEDDEGSATARMRTPEAYEFTVRSTLAVTERVLGGDAPPGYRTPAGAYGPELATSIEGVELADC